MIHLMMGLESVPETLYILNHMTRLEAREDLIISNLALGIDVHPKFLLIVFLRHIIQGVLPHARRNRFGIGCQLQQVGDCET
jgi:hypothetical protein